MAAAKIGQDTLLPSLELAVEDYSGLVGSCDVGFSCTYMNTISWRTPTSPMPMEINPRVVFDRMFGDGATAQGAPAAHRHAAQHSRRGHRPGAAAAGRSGRRSDRNRVAEYLDTVREIERRIQLSERQAANPSLAVPESPTGIPDDHEAHTKLMFDLMAIAFQADITRISTFMMAREVSYRTFPKLGISEAFHPGVASSEQSGSGWRRWPRSTPSTSSLVAYLLDRLKATPDGDGNLLDHSLILYGSAMSNSNVHNHAPLPVLVAGGAAGRLKGGRHLKYPEGTPMSNLLLTILDKAGVPQEKRRRQHRAAVGGVDRVSRMTIRRSTMRSIVLVCCVSR